jgi:basic membrane protein A
MFKSKWLILGVFSVFGTLAQAAPIQVGLVLDKGGRDDKSFNESAFRGATRAEKEGMIQLKTVEATDDAAFENLIRAFAKKNYDLILSIGFAQAEAVKKVAKQFPDRKFVIVDSEVALPNVRSVMFEEHEGSYLVGAIAALKSKSGKIGFVGGMDIPLIRRFQMGYEAGAKAVNPNIRIVTNYVGITGDAWNNPPKGKELARAQYEQGVDAIFAPAGASSLGVFDAAEERKAFAIGVDSNQNWIKPGLILTSMLKRIDLAVYEACKDFKDGKLTAGTVRRGLKDNGVDYAVDQYNEKLLPKELLTKVNGLKTKVVAGSIQVPDYYKTQN